MKSPLGANAFLPEAERELARQHAAEIAELLPVLAPPFGLVIILFNAWDWLIDPANAVATLAVRIALVLAGSIAYTMTSLPWTPTQRCAHIYLTHVGAIVICEYLLRDGFLYGVAGIAVCTFIPAVITLSLRIFFLLLLLPTVMFVALSAHNLPELAFANGLMLYLFSVGLAAIVLLVVRAFHRRAFLSEQRLLHVSRHDSLSGAYNRGFLTELAEREVALAIRHGRPLAAAMLDIDHFKCVNDTYGHDIGDQVIQKLAATCTENLRTIDHFGRVGGEEFVCVLPETGKAEALSCAERLRQAIEALSIDTQQGELHFTVSVGVALLNPELASWAALLKDADTALYKAKNDGRNRVALAEKK